MKLLRPSLTTPEDLSVAVCRMRRGEVCSAIAVVVRNQTLFEIVRSTAQTREITPSFILIHHVARPSGRNPPKSPPIIAQSLPLALLRGLRRSHLADRVQVQPGLLAPATSAALHSRAELRVQIIPG